MSMMYGITMFLVGVLAVGCGSVAATVDAQPTPDGPNADAVAPECDVTKPFAAAAEVPGLHNNPAATDLHATLTVDELTIYFASDRFDLTMQFPPMHIYTSTRTTRDAVFSAPAAVGPTFSAEGESNPSISPDGNTLFFDSSRTAGVLHVFTSTRANVSVVFPMPTMIAGDYLHTPSITADGKVLYTADLAHGYLARLDKAGSGFGEPQRVDTQFGMSVTSPVSRDDLTLYMSLGEQIGSEILATKRTSTNSPWPTPTQVTELKTNAVQAAPNWISADGCRLYLTYTPSAGKSTIYMAARPK
jgi:hypothetical protein